MEIHGEISGVEYKPYLCEELDIVKFRELGRAINKERKSNFIIELSKGDRVAVSIWVSPKRTRSYPYARVYNTLCFSGRRVAIIPVMKDEGKDGDRDFVQWDTLSLMSLLQVYVILAYYTKADKNRNYTNKITNQRFSVRHIKNELRKLMSYQSDALHWNLMQIDRIHTVFEKAVRAYKRISYQLGVEMHSLQQAKERIDKIYLNKSDFLRISREMAQEAQNREVRTIQPKERVEGTKAKITIKNYLGGYYYFTCDEVAIDKNNDMIFLIEAKHSRGKSLPSLSDIKDGLLKIILYTNLNSPVRVYFNHTSRPLKLKPKAVLKLTTGSAVSVNKNKGLLPKLIHEARSNRFGLIINDTKIA